MALFAPALMKVLRHEGVVWEDGNDIPVKTGYVNLPRDPGGETNWGITIKTARANGYEGPMADMPLCVATKIYKDEYWDAIHGDDIEHQGIAEEMMDTAVNMGPARVIKYLQEVLNAFNDRGARWPDIEVDGLMGAQTIDYLNRALAFKPYYGAAIVKYLNCLQGTRYIETRAPWVPAWGERL